MDKPDPSPRPYYNKGLLKFFFICAAILGFTALVQIVPPVVRYFLGERPKIQQAQLDLVKLSVHMENKDFPKALQTLDTLSQIDIYPWEEALFRAAISLEQKDYDQARLNLELMKLREQKILFPEAGLSTHRVLDPKIMMSFKNLKPAQKRNITPFKEELMLCYPLVYFKNTEEGQIFSLKRIICNSAKALEPME